MDSSKEIIQFYDAFADNYDATVLKGKDYTAFEKIPFWLLDTFPNEKLHILDLGCGTGLGSRPFIQAGHSVTGMDISSQMIEQAGRLAYHQLICQSLEEPLPLGDALFDGTLLLGVMEFIQNPENLFQEVNRVLKQNGLFGLTIPKKLALEQEENLSILTCDLEKIESLFFEAGFSILKKEDFQGFIYNEEVVPYRGYLLRKNSLK